jgi:glycine hydroxymethyltransferase
MHVIAAKAVCFNEALKPEFKEYQKRIVKNAKALAEGLLDRKVNLVSGGTDNHLMLLDLRGTGVTGKDLERRLDYVGITANKNAIPNDPLGPNVTSGLRLGTPAVTTRGMNESDMEEIADIIYNVLKDENYVDTAKSRVKKLLDKYPLYE